MDSTAHHFPFSAVLGQQQFKLALQLVAVNPLIGGLLVSGPRGCAKSTLARSLAAVLSGVKQQQANFVTLPLAATEEMLVGTLDLNKVLSEQQVQFQPGMLAKADGGVLYVDEVNLLPDNLVDLLLDVAASGMNRVERDGISHQHDAKFVLLGTMNPDEGELREQLVDRFGLSVQLSNQIAIEDRIDIVERREAFDADPLAFISQYQAEQDQLAEQIQQAQKLLASVSCSREGRFVIAKACSEANVDGLRADIVWLQAARAHAALRGQQTVEQLDIDAVEELVLTHRRQSQPPQSKQQPETQPPFQRPPQSRQNQSDSSQRGGHDSEKKSPESSGDWGAMAPQQQAVQNITELALPTMPTVKVGKATNASANNRKQGNSQGLRATNGQPSKQVNWFGTVLTNQTLPKEASQQYGGIELKQLKFKPQKRGAKVVHLVLLDTSASVLAQQSFAKAKGLVKQIAEQAYLSRQQLSLIGFGNDQVATHIPMRRPAKTVETLLNQISAGGGTPIQQGLQQIEQLQKQLLKQNSGVQLHTYVITDGRIRAVPQNKLTGQISVIDIEQAQVKRGRCRELAAQLGAEYIVIPT